MTRLWILLGVLVLQCSCKDKQDEVALTDCYFQYEYVNYALGYQHSGFTITPAGEVYTFNRLTPWVFSTETKISSADLKKNIALSVKADTLIAISDIIYYMKLALPASDGGLSQPVSQGADMGSLGCSVFIPEQDNTGSYRQVILNESGDWEQHNLAPEAGVLTQWLTNLRIH